ncbi:MAG: hypothetical protein KY476_01020 [Planctomycetes bacterium]|nr:hypothetical protein [Planctomycetota bacterium]
MARKKAAKAKRPAVRKKAAAKKPSRKKAAARKVVRAKRPAAKKKSGQKSLGRPRVGADARLDVLFQKDYQAREVFEFLGVTTIRELEEHPPQEIVERLTAPMVQTVQRIRKTLALVNRCLAGDRQFALEFKGELGRPHSPPRKQGHRR